GYIGALGSRRTHEDRARRLAEHGITDEQLSRVNSPCGLDVGARTPAETAIAVLGEILALRAGRDGGRLARTSGPIHSRPAPVATAPPSGTPSPREAKNPPSSPASGPTSQRSPASAASGTERTAARRCDGDATTTSL